MRRKLVELRPRVWALATKTGAKLSETAAPDLVEELHAWMQRACSFLAWAPPETPQKGRSR